MYGFLRVIQRAAPRPIALRAGASLVAQIAAFAVCGFCVDPGKEPRTFTPEGRTRGPGQVKGKLARENHKVGFKHNRTSHPIPCSPIHTRVAETAAVAACGSRPFIHSSSTIPDAGDEPTALKAMPWLPGTPL
jgi:hypothetical protein